MSKKLTLEEFIEKANKIHHCSYDYSKVEYINAHTKVCIICPEHGEFWQKPNKHISQKQSCPMCKLKKMPQCQSFNTEEFIDRARKVHFDRYDYSKVEYTNTKTKIQIICPIHGIFCQKPNSHLQGCGCPKCQSSHLENKVEEILKKK